MGDPNTGSTITAKLNRLARRRMRYVRGTPAQQAAVGILKADLAGSMNAGDARARALAGHLGVGTADPIIPAKTQREMDHINIEVPEDILLLSLEYVDMVVSNDIPCSYSVSRGNEWEVKLVFSLPEILDPDEEPPSEGQDQQARHYFEAQISWVVPGEAELVLDERGAVLLDEDGDPVSALDPA